MARSLRIATFNLESLDDRPDLEPPLEARIAVLRPQMERLEADVLCLQEVNGQRPPGGGPRRLLALERLLEGTPYADYHRATSHRVAGGADDGGVDAVHNLVVLSRYPVRETTELRHHLVEPPIYRATTAEPPAVSAEPIEWDRPILHAALALPGGRLLHVIDLHLRAPLAAPIAGQKADPLTWKSVSGWAEGFFLATVKRAGQALETRLLIERLFEREAEALICVCGDFNAEERQTPLRTIRGAPDDTGNPALATRTLVPLDRALPDARRYSVVHGGYREMLDHLLVSQALFAAFRKVEIDNRELTDELFDIGPESHHAPLVAAFEIEDS